MKSFVSHIPNLITLLNLTFGVVSIVLALEGRLVASAVVILFAAILDFLDGMAARLLKAYSDIGKELDSLADVVSFGVAPAMIYLGLMHKNMAYGTSLLPGPDAPLAIWFFLGSALLIPAASAYRLAKFNIDTRQSNSFLGLPTPANAILWAGLAFISQMAVNQILVIKLLSPINLLTLAILTSLLMLSELPMFSLKLTNFKLAHNWHRFLLFVIALLLVGTAGIQAPALIVIAYILLSMFLYLFKIKV